MLVSVFVSYLPASLSFCFPLPFCISFFSSVGACTCDDDCAYTCDCVCDCACSMCVVVPAIACASACDCPLRF